MNEGILFSELTLDGIPLKDCELVFKGLHDNSRLFVHRYPENNSFYACAVEFNSYSGNGEKWESNDLRVNVIFEVIAYFDGVRQLKFTDDGYLYYPVISDLIGMLQKIKEIEIEICQ